MSNNPALTAPASHGLHCCSPGQMEGVAGGEDVSFSGAKRHEELKKRAENAQTKTAAASKYDVGWRRVVRHFSPA
jgi:hypothetical protein